MWKNYLKIAFRNLFKRKAYSFINIAGLAIGMACSILIFLSVRHDLLYDRFHEKADRIYRVLTIDQALGVSSQRVGITLPALGPAMEAELPEVEETVRMTGGGRALLSYEDKDLYAEDVLYAEGTFFEVFSFPLLQGDPQHVLSEPLNAVLTERMAQRLFGDADPIGKTVTLDNDAELTITGVAANPPSTSHIGFDVLVALLPTAEQPGFQEYLASWNSISMTTYALLKDARAAEGLDAKLNQILRKNDVSDNFSVTIQPLSDVHLYSSNILFDPSQNRSDAGYVYGLGVVGLFILVIACINFMNLATARSAERAKEVGVRKVVGAQRRQLIAQHLSESLVLCLLAFALALVLVAAVLPPFNAALNKSLALDLLHDPMLGLFLIGLGVAVALLSGSYPAFVLSRFEPARVLKGTFKTDAHGTMLRKGLVVLQFTASVVMIVGSLIVARQLGYIMERNMGYNRDQVVVLEMDSPEVQERSETLKDELLRQPGVLDVTQSSSLPGRPLGRTGVQPEGASEEDNWIMSILSADEHYLPLLDIKMAEGRNFSRERGTDTLETVIINEAAARSLGWADPLGKTLVLGEQERKVIGVMEDFHFASVRHQIEPLLVLYNQGSMPLLSLKVDATQLPQTLRAVEATWSRLHPSYPFEYSFLDDEFAEQYEEEANFALLSEGFAFLSILIACLGLFGLASFTAEQRTKEIGVRKVLGASVPGLVALLSKGFLKLVGLAFVLAVPVAYFAARAWLSDFAYRIDLGPGLFLLAGGLALLIALLTISYQATKAALADPVKSLRYE